MLPYMYFEQVRWLMARNLIHQGIGDDHSHFRLARDRWL